MFIKALEIANDFGVIRTIDFRAGLNLIVDETPQQGDKQTGNSVGKTTVLMLIDFCLGAAGKGLFTDPENRKNEYALVKNFLIETAVLVTLILVDDLNDSRSRRIVIERNFLSSRRLVRRINGEHKTEEEFERDLTNHLFPGHFGKKPTFRQIISHNIRYKEQSVNNTLKTLDAFTRDDEYETLYLFLLGCNFDRGDEKQNIVGRIKVESAFKARLESQQTLSAYETARSVLAEEIAALNEKKSAFHVNANFEEDLAKLNDVKFAINAQTSRISRLRLRRDLIQEAVIEISDDRSNVDVVQLRKLYEQVTRRVEGIQKSFAQLHEFHNRMVEEKARYVAQDLPSLKIEIEVLEAELRRLLKTERIVADKVARSDSFEALELLIIGLNDKHRKLGEYDTIIQQVTEVDATLRALNDSLAAIDDALFSDEFEQTIKAQLKKFNKHFSAVSRWMYGESYALKVDHSVNRASQRVYKFTAFNVNFSSGKKQGEISCFDIAYVLFADDENIPCYHFLLNDKKELMHDNQLIRIRDLVEKPEINVQFVASILKDKLPAELHKEEYFVVKLSQEDKLFLIEQSGSSN